MSSPSFIIRLSRLRQQSIRDNLSLDKSKHHRQPFSTLPCSPVPRLRLPRIKIWREMRHFISTCLRSLRGILGWSSRNATRNRLSRLWSTPLSGIGGVAVRELGETTMKTQEKWSPKFWVDTARTGASRYSSTKEERLGRKGSKLSAPLLRPLDGGRLIRRHLRLCRPPRLTRFPPPLPMPLQRNLQALDLRLEFNPRETPPRKMKDPLLESTPSARSSLRTKWWQGPLFDVEPFLPFLPSLSPLG